MMMKISLPIVLAALFLFANRSQTSLFANLRSGNGLRKLKIVIYETGDYSTSLQTFLNATKQYGMDSIVVGQGSTFSGFGSKYTQLKDTLDELKNDPESLIAVIDGRDVLLNVGYDVNHHQFERRVRDFIENFKELTEDKPEAVLISAEQQCCVSALCYADSPSYYFDPATGKRVERACPSGEEGCMWLNDGHAEHWQTLMKKEAYSQTKSHDVSPYLNAGMMVGTAQNLINLISFMDLGEEEDDQAVLSALYLQFPEKVVLDYNQKLLGNNEWPKGLEQGCIYDFDPTIGGNTYLTNKETGTSPLILHTPGKFYDCLDTLIERLGGKSDQRYIALETERSLQSGGNYNYNYGSSNYGGNYAPANYAPANYGSSNYGGNYAPANYAPANYNYGETRTGSSNYGNYGGSSNYGGNYGSSNYGTNYGINNYGTMTSDQAEEPTECYGCTTEWSSVWHSLWCFFVRLYNNC